MEGGDGGGGARGSRPPPQARNFSFNNKRYSADDMARLAHANRQATLAQLGMVGGQSLDEIVNQNSQEQQRRRSFQQRYLQATQSNNDGRANTMDFTSPAPSDLDGYSFASPLPHSPHGINNGGMTSAGEIKTSGAQGTPGQGMTLDTTPMGEYGVMDAMVQSPLFQDHMDPDAMNLDMPNNNFLDMPLDSNYNDSMDAGLQPGLGMFSPNQYETMRSPMPNNGSRSAHSTVPDRASANMAGETMDHSMMEKMPRINMPGGGFRAAQPGAQSTQPSPNRSIGHTPNSGMLHGVSPNSGHMSSHGGQNHSNFGMPSAPSMTGYNQQAGLPDNQQKALSQYLNAYSQSGFDMLGILMRVAARPKPQINIGAVDMSCAFVVCDVSQHDIPIVYCSEMFERLTGYVKHEILGRNCRFLQAPDGKVQSGVARRYVDDKSVYYLKAMINQRQEAQISLINYRKGGQPFMNLLTMIPISWDSDEIRYIVGFQVDLVEQPTSITNKNPDGSYSINYQRGLLPRYVVHNTPETNRAKEFETGHSVGSDEVSSVLSTFGSGDSEYSKRIWDKIVIENTDDVVHVLSLKGLFLYISPAGKKVLEYDQSELVGTPLSSVCHPSDIVPVTRELKDTAPGSTVNVVFRIRRKHSGYTWFESHGSLHTEQGKGKKCIILTGRERPVYALQRKDIVNVTEIGDNELWSKMSTTGMFLFVATHSKSLLDRQPEDLIGTSAQTLMRRESKDEFNRMLELARSGRIVTLKHDIQNRRGQTLHAQSTLYPGDASEGTKPTFLIVQTKLLKMLRTAPALHKQSSGGSNVNEGSSAGGGGSLPPAVTSPQRAISNQFPSGVYTAAGGSGFAVGTQHETLAAEDNLFDELQTTRSTSWQFELRQMEKRNRVLAEELQSLNSSKKKRKRRKGLGQIQKDCANCHTRNTPEWRRGPSGNRDLCNSCGLRWAKQNGRVSPRTSSQQSDKASASPNNSSPRGIDAAKSGHSLSPPTASMGNTKAAQERQLEVHNAKASRMEAAKATSDYGGGISAKIEEGVEPMDD